MDATTENEKFIDLKIELAEQLWAILQGRKLNKSQFARLLGVSRTYTHKVLTGEENLTIKSLVKMAHALGVDLTVSIGTPGKE